MQNSTICKYNCHYEISKYGILISKGKEVKFNDINGYLVRIKSANSNEGGIMHGSGALCCLTLIEETGE